MEAATHRHVSELWTVANDYCLFLENCKDYKADEINEYLRKVVPLLYVKGSLLPAPEFNDDLIPERFVSEEHYENVFMAVLQKYQNYPKVLWESLGSNPEYLAEGLADIYQDLKDFSILLQKPLSAEKQNAISEVSASFQGHWGQRLAELLPILHNVSIGNAEDADDTLEEW
jgi:hypothetical protein